MDIALPGEEGRSARYRLVGQPARPVIGARFSRIAYAAAHVVADPLAMTDPWSRRVVDWERTMAFRHHLWRLGFRIAEAMDTSQRGMGFDWTSAQELIRRSIAEARTVDGADLASGAGTDHLAPAAARTLIQRFVSEVRYCSGATIVGCLNWATSIFGSIPVSA